MSAKRELAQARAEHARARFQMKLYEARQRLAPGALAAEGAEAVASRAARFAKRSQPSSQILRVLGTAGALAAIGVAVILRLAQARTTMKPDGSLAVDDTTPIEPTRGPL